mmetsp:Transcript_300/g.562  ORF Transcript_300/g.562 Transcript_300/m.562 type:complete len:140 (+) Transcript_300:683-1102(+)|eukprot:CAMPEP_0178988762 /NCGR_PEP_ID=MMETSP0795-20121207/3982_1 /TAXON_ID=88552 /ORGANISM="Amoebophrya sp., Strain Ameob2" /LENGTH=139 /DNA_ID=CAMNT_0020680055 /DNA_START=676 /DNA_END=1095 /DNA_ORIENTATION=+
MAAPQQPQVAGQPPQYVYAAAPPQQTHVIVTPRLEPVACRDDNNPIGALGYDKRVPAPCVCKLFCAPWIYLNYEGCTLITALLFLIMPAFAAPCWYVLFCWQEPIMGVHYGKKTIMVAQGGVAPQVVVAAGDSDDDYEE